MNKRLYAIVMISIEGDKRPTYSIEPLGIYSSLEKALQYVESLEEVSSSQKDTIYDVVELELDAQPFMLDFLEKERKMKEEALEDMIIKLMGKGFVDQLVGEDGNFYYTLTDLGKKSIKSDHMPDHIKKFFDKKNKE